MKTRNGMNPRKKKTTLGVALALAIALAAGVATVLAVDDEGLFELEGDALDNFPVNPTPGDDWNTVVPPGDGGNSLTNVFIADGVDTSTPADVTYFKGGSKDTLDITGWTHTSPTGNPAAPDKDEITNAYAAAYNFDSTPGSPGGEQLIIYFGADRFDTSGDAQIGFWFFQSGVNLGPDGTFVDANGDLAEHDIGDILVISNFVGGGATSEIRVYEWVGSGGSDGTLDLLASNVSPGTAVCTDDDEACAVANAATATAPWSYLSKTGQTNFPARAFFEGGVNLTALGLSQECISSFMAESRSSQSVTASQKDFALGDFNTCGLTVTKECTAQLNTAGTGVTVTIGGQVCNIGFATQQGVTVVDNHAGTVFGPASLGAQTCANYTGSYSSSTLSNTDTVTASAPGVESTTADAECTADTQPEISVTKNCEATTLETVPCDGGSVVAVRIHFSGEVCNAGDVALSNVTVTDDPASDDIVLSSTTLAPLACATFTGSYLPSSTSDSNPGTASFTDTATARGTAVLGTRQPEPATSSPASDCPVCPS